jgi:hypothetical protein
LITEHKGDVSPENDWEILLNIRSVFQGNVRFVLKKRASVFGKMVTNGTRIILKGKRNQ